MARQLASSKKIRVGVVGLGQGQAFMRGIAGLELVAICDIWKSKLRELGRRLKVATYADYDKFLQHDMDAVALANYFHQHAPFAIKALEAGFHVISECTACKTLAEGVALCRAVEKSGRVYMLAENYPYTVCNVEMQRLYGAGEIGRVLYAEGEDNHPMSGDDRMRISPGMHHWRHWMPPTYYSTHAMAPLMTITDTMPVSVNGLTIAAPELDMMTVRRGDPGFVILCRMDNGAVFRLFGLLVPGHSIWYRLHGLRGSMESVRGGGYWGPGLVRIVHEPWDLKSGELRERTYTPGFPRWAVEAGLASEGGYSFPNYYFAQAIRTGRKPFMDVYRAVAMSAVGILAWKSAMEGGRPFDVPDFRKESQRKKYQDDRWSPFPEDAGPGQPPATLCGNVQPSAKAVARARKIWRDIGYVGE
jgi:predicted dehydrogenase